MADGGNIKIDNPSWLDKEQNRDNPNQWLEKLRPQIMERIAHYEKFLDKWGITAQTGIEQEFYPIPKDGVSVAETLDTLGEKPTHKYFSNSPYVEDLYHDGRRIDIDRNSKPLEIVVGTGNKKAAKSYPHKSLTPSVMVRATEATNKLIAREASKPDNPYKTKSISFDGVDDKRRLHAQQVNISLWDKHERPIFNSTEVKELAHLSIKNLLNAQHELIAAFTISPNTYQRFNKSNNDYANSESPPAYAGGFTLVQASLGHNLPALVFLYNAV
ncbi:MAG: hypothetical protein R3D71_07705 [Rickettsiales bacterium]